MPVRKESEDLVRVTLNLYERDYERLKELHPTIGAAKAIRQMVRNYLTRLDRQSAAAAMVPTLEIELE